jgi:hypothetical protein
MLHFPPDNLLAIYIIVCDWGDGKRLGEDNPSPYGFAKKKEIPTQRQGSSMAGGIKALKLETYLVGKLVQLIWQEEIDVEYFADSSTMSHFRVQLREMLDPNPNMARSPQLVMNVMMGPPYNWTPPK